MKKITSNIACFISGVIIASTVGAVAATYTATENTFPIKVNGQNVQMEGYNIDGSTYFKLRDIGDKMGFDVGFKDNTIYVGEVPTQTTEPISSNNNNSDGIKYYSEKSWCPDFGAFTGAELLETKTTDKGAVSYKYDALSVGDNFTEYYDLILKVTDLKLNPASAASFIMFENLKTGHTVVSMLSKTEGTITIIVE